MAVEGQVWPTKEYEAIQAKHIWQFDKNVELRHKQKLNYYIDETKSDLSQDEVLALVDLCCRYDVDELLFNDGKFKVSELLKEMSPELTPQNFPF